MASVPRREANQIPLVMSNYFALENTLKDAYLGSKNLVGPLDLKKKNSYLKFFFLKKKIYVSSTLLEEQVPPK